MRLVIIDTSYESMLNIDYMAAKASGVHGVILHAGYGKDAGQTDPAFKEAYDRAIAAGLYVGAYWMNYFKTTEDAVTEAEVFNQAIIGCDLQLGVYADYEEDTIAYMDRSGGSKADFTSRIITFMDRMIELGNPKSRFYSNTNCFNGADGADALDANRLLPYGFWHAHYNGDEGTQETEFNGLVVVGHQFANNDDKPAWIQGCPNIDVSIFNLDDINVPEQVSSNPVEEVQPPATEEPNLPTLNHTVGEDVTFNAIFASSTSTDALTPYYNTGKITRIVLANNAPNPYLINEGTGWVNDSCIVGAEPVVVEPVSEPSINEGSIVRVKDNINYDSGDRFSVYFDEYNVIELRGARAVIGIGSIVTAPIDVMNLELV